MDSPPGYETESKADFKDLEEQLRAAILGQGSDDTRLVIGLDFGTTYSGVAYAFSNKPDSIYTIDTWPGSGGRSSAKCPTLIEYTDNHTLKWGFEVERTSAQCIEGIKLLLDPDQPKPIYLPSRNSSAEIGRLQKTPVEVATDYIDAIYKHANSVIESKEPKDYLDMIPRQYILSVPAVWSDKAKSTTLRAARQAGIAPVTLIKEPEAAALFTIHSMGEKGLEVGDALVLCDAGGGTVDLISYEITNLHPFELAELTVATGGLAGSLGINQRFEDWIESVVGERPYLDLKEKPGYRKAMRDFDIDIKPGFKGRTDNPAWVSFPGARLADNPHKGLEGSAVQVTGDNLFEIFDPVVREVCRLIKEQVNDAQLNRMKKERKDGLTIKAIFLVGGFGSNKYILDQVEKAHPKIQVIQPNDAWSAIVRGAVLSQLPTKAQVVTNIAPKHYGHFASARYKEAEDRGQPKVWDEYEEDYLTRRMTWYIEKGDDLKRNRKISFPFYITFAPNPSDEQLQWSVDLLECSLDDAPLHPQEGITIKNCTLNVDLSTVPKTQFKKKSRTNRADGSTIQWWKLDFKLLVSVQSGPMLFSLECGKKELGQVDAEY